ncbi:hypothetical protein K437DRAFT_276180 [Tilletiaria anomala UBC 951]|uniref:Uncharacterized protein n=1 Tax=Tilletiaria anomala (strain ATCC 24038 / CBS 436.72 / UBC 951) TaxID=1037660 RepID=A0A066VBE0_TILAU|nr:uncharacterized protein K437DRAFT_276180 [Tilletiaria anomala UBC 951]KDN38776.1 hypothetical protein K437DRAFT_276180 [Tilletiaria anomala UBC 951]
MATLYQSFLPRSSSATLPPGSLRFSTAQTSLNQQQQQQQQQQPSASTSTLLPAKSSADTSADQSASWASAASSTVKGIFSSAAKRFSLSPQKRGQEDGDARCAKGETYAIVSPLSKGESASVPLVSTPPLSPLRRQVLTPHSSPSYPSPLKAYSQDASVKDSAALSPARSGSSGTPSPPKKKRTELDLQQLQLPSPEKLQAPNSSASAAGSIVLKKRRLEDADISWISTSERAADEVEHISSPPGATSIDEEEAAEELVPKKPTSQKMDRFGNPLLCMPHASIRCAPRARTLPARSKCQRALQFDEDEDDQSASSDKDGSIDGHEKFAPRSKKNSLISQSRKRRSDRQLPSIDESEDQSGGSHEGTGGGSDGGSDEDDEDVDFLALIRKRAAARVEARKAAGMEPVLDAVTRTGITSNTRTPELGVLDDGPISTRGTRIRMSALEAQKGLSGTPRSALIDKKPMLLAARSNSPARDTPRKPKNRFLDRLLKKRQDDRARGTNAAALEALSKQIKAAEVLEEAERGLFWSDGETVEGCSKAGERSSDVECEAFDTWEDMRAGSDSESSISYETSPNKAAQSKALGSSPVNLADVPKGNGNAHELDHFRSLFNEIAGDASKGAIESRESRGNTRGSKSKDKDVMDTRVDVVDIVEADRAQNTKQDEANAKAKQLRKDTWFWLQEHIAVPNVSVATPWSAPTGSKILDAATLASKSPVALHAFFEAGILHNFIGHLIVNECVASHIASWLADLAIYSDFHEAALSTIACAISEIAHPFHARAFATALFERIARSFSMLGARPLVLKTCLDEKARSLPPPTKMAAQRYTGTATLSTESQNLLHLAGKLNDAKTCTPMKRSTRLRLTGRLLDVFDLLAQFDQLSLTPKGVLKQKDRASAAMLVYWLGLDSLEGQQTRSRALALKLFGGPVLPSTARDASLFPSLDTDGQASIARKLVELLKDKPFSHVRHWLEHLPAESPSSRNISRWVAASCLVHRHSPAMAQRSFEVIEQALPAVLKAIDHEDPANPFHITQDTDFTELESAPIVVLYALSDFALQMCLKNATAASDVLDDGAADNCRFATSETAMTTRLWTPPNPRSAVGQALDCFVWLYGMRPKHDKIRLFLLEALENRLREASTRITDSKGQAIAKGKAREMLVRVSLALRYMHSLYGNRKCNDKFDYDNGDTDITDHFRPLISSSTAGP